MTLRNIYVTKAIRVIVIGESVNKIVEITRKLKARLAVRVIHSILNV